MDDLIDILCPILIFGCLIAICVGIPMAANYQEAQDYDKHKQYIGDSIILAHDTVKVMEWRTGRWDDNRGYVLSNGMTVDELVVESAEKTVE